MKGFRGVVLVSSLLVLGLCAQVDQVAKYRAGMHDAFNNVYGKNRPFQNYLLQRVDASVWQQFLTLLCQFVQSNAPKLSPQCNELSDIHRQFVNLFVQNFERNIVPLITDPALATKGTADLSKIKIREMRLGEMWQMIKVLEKFLEILFEKTQKVANQLQQKSWFEGSTTREIRGMLLEVAEVQMMIIGEALRQMKSLFELFLDANPDSRISDILSGLKNVAKEYNPQKRWQETLKVLGKEPDISYRRTALQWHPDKFFAKNPELREDYWEKLNQIFNLITTAAEAAGKK